jgi:hypothetical protein
MNLTTAQWRKSSHSGDQGGQCVEVATNLPGIIAVRDSKNPTAPALTFTPDEWRTFLGGVKRGQPDA